MKPDDEGLDSVLSNRVLSITIRHLIAYPGAYGLSAMIYLG